MKVMKRYRLRPDRVKRKIYIERVGFFGGSIIKRFSTDEFAAAMEFVKQLAAANRPSRVTTLDGQGNLRRQWEYKAKTIPKVYETKPRRMK